jgi:hypothetical protein
MNSQRVLTAIATGVTISVAILCAAPGARAASPGGVTLKGAAFVHVANTGTGGNVCPNDDGSTFIDHPLANGKPDAFILVTDNQGAVSNQAGVTCVRNSGGLVLYYDQQTTNGCAQNRWVIIACALDSALINGQKYNVLIVSP